MITIKTPKLNEKKKQKNVMQTKISIKNTIYCIMLRTSFSEKSLKKYSQKNENWTIINVQFSENQKRIQIGFSEIILLFQ